MFALKFTPLAPAKTVVIRVIVTDTGGIDVIVNASKSDFVPSAFEVAVSVTVGEAGTVAGGV